MKTKGVSLMIMMMIMMNVSFAQTESTKVGYREIVCNWKCFTECSPLMIILPFFRLCVKSCCKKCCKSDSIDINITGIYLFLYKITFFIIL